MNASGPLDQETLSHVFNFFFQGEASLNRERGGMGIGLAMVRVLAELHGGSVQVSSPGPGHGSEVVVRLPCLEPIPERQAPASVSTNTSCQSRRVLVVEDNPDQASLLAKLLEIWGHRVQVAHDGPAAIEAACAQAPEVVLVDIGLPGMSGYELARALRMQPGLKEALLMAVSGYGQEEDRRRSLEAGFDQHLVKPVDPPTLKGLIASLVATS